MDTFAYIVLAIFSFLAGWSLYKVFDITVLEVNRLSEEVHEVKESYLKFLNDFKELLEKHEERRQKEQELKKEQLDSSESISKK